MVTATQGVKVTSPCVACGGVLVRDVGQFIDRGQLRWGVEGRCHGCPNAWCEMGVAPAPEKIRQALLAEHGGALLHLAAEDASVVPVMRALRERRGLSLEDARLTAADLRGAGLVGTFVEMTHLADGVRKHSVATTLTPATI